MTFIHIKKIQAGDPDNGGMRDLYAVPSVAIATPQGRKLIPNPSGNEASLFPTLEEAEEAIRRSGFDYIYEGKKTYTLREEKKATPAASSQRSLEEAAPILIRHLHDRESSVVANAVYALGAMKAYSALDSLVTILGHDDPTVRKNVAEAMANMGRTALPYLRDAYEEALSSTSKNAPYVRLTVVVAFLEMIPGSPYSFIEQFLPLAVQALEDESWLVRSQAALVVGRAAEARAEEKAVQERLKKP